MKRQTAKTYKKFKRDIKNRYLAGDPIASIAIDYGVVVRDIYHHLGKLTAEEKGIHAMNLSLKTKSKKGGPHGRKNTNTDQIGAKSAGEETGTCLDDFK